MQLSSLKNSNQTLTYFKEINPIQSKLLVFMQSFANRIPTESEIERTVQLQSAYLTVMDKIVLSLQEEAEDSLKNAQEKKFGQ